MTIPVTKYVAITSAAVQSSEMTRKDLIPRILTTNPLLAVNTVYEFTSSSDVKTLLGSSSAEYLIASEYFGWISKTAEQAEKISFMRYSFDALAPFMYSTISLTPLATFKAITDGSVVINLGGTSYTITGLDFSEITAYADIASILQTALRANEDGGELWTSATVEYDSSNSCFILTGGITGANEIAYASAADEGTDISNLIGFDSAAQPVLSEGTDDMEISDILDKTIDISTNFLTIGFTDPEAAIDNLAAIGAWINEQNNNYRFCFDVSSSNYAEAIETASSYEGMTANYNINYGIEGVNPAWLMSAILPATTDYDAKNGVKNYMFQVFDEQAVSVGVDDDGTLYQTLDNLCINYNGQTQKSGKTTAFYQNGFNADGTDSAVFDNEAWLKDAITTDMLNAFLGLDYISADSDGIAVLTAVLQNNCEEALNNHVFSKGKTLDTTQKAYINQLTGDKNSYLEVQNNGYIFDVDITSETSGSAEIYAGEYTLIYLKNDVIRKVSGKNILV